MFVEPGLRIVNILFALIGKKRTALDATQDTNTRLRGECRCIFYYCTPNRCNKLKWNKCTFVSLQLITPVCPGSKNAAIKNRPYDFHKKKMLKNTNMKSPPSGCRWAGSPVPRKSAWHCRTWARRRSPSSRRWSSTRRRQSTESSWYSSFSRRRDVLLLPAPARGNEICERDWWM